METQSIVSATDWLKYTADLGTYIFLIGALLQYVVIRFQAQISIPQTLTMLIISRAISIIIAWMIWFVFPHKWPYIVSEFVFIPAVFSEIIVLIISYFIVRYSKKQHG